jgi:hypothetical protein
VLLKFSGAFAENKVERYLQSTCILLAADNHFNFVI